MHRDQFGLWSVVLHCMAWGLRCTIQWPGTIVARCHIIAWCWWADVTSKNGFSSVVWLLLEQDTAGLYISRLDIECRLSIIIWKYEQRGWYQSVLSVSMAWSISLFSGANKNGWFFIKRWFKADAIGAKLGTNYLKTLHRPRKDLSAVKPAEGLSSQIASVVCEAGSKRRGRITCPT